MTAALAVPETLRMARSVTPSRMTYRELVTRWFKDKASQDQWPPTLDTLPGIVLTKRHDAAGCLEIGVTQTWVQSARRTLEGILVCEPEGWRSPRHYRFRQTFKTAAGAPAWPDLTESGEWAADGTLTRRSGTNGQTDRRQEKADLWLSSYALLADFPAECPPWPAEAAGALLGEGLATSSGVAVTRCSQAQCEHPLAAGLRGFTVTTKSGMPVEYWINAHGTVIFMCEGPNRAWAIANVEALA